MVRKTLSSILIQEHGIELPNNKQIWQLPNGLIFIVDDRDSFGKVNDLSLGEGHEYYLVKKILELVGPGDTYVEVGSNYGDFALLVSQKLGSTGKLYTFEPGKKLYEYFTTSIFLNGVTNIVAENLAVLDYSQQINFFENIKESLGSSVMEESNDLTQSVKAVSLDEYFRGIEHGINFVRLDAEGSECKVLDGAKNIINFSDDVMFCIDWQMPLLIKYQSVVGIKQCLSNLLDKGYVFIDLLSVKEECNYLNYQFSIDDLLRLNAAELLVVKPMTLEKLGKTNNHIDDEYCAYVPHRLIIYNAIYGDVEAVRRTLDEGTDVNFFERGLNALYASVENGHYNVAKLLLERGADTEIKAINQITPLYRSVVTHNYDLVELLLNYSANTETLSRMDITPLFAAAYLGYDDILKLLLANGANKNTQVQGTTPFEISLERGHINTAQLLAGSTDGFCQLITNTDYEITYSGLCEEVVL
ncbi:MAG: FkbM family methyltransferase [Rickettsiales bacterium]|jgi:FkbM family methyltransferase|nr:FkbM family methyltransferase [Rickettsiales bacterium]